MFQRWPSVRLYVCTSARHLLSAICQCVRGRVEVASATPPPVECFIPVKRHHQGLGLRDRKRKPDPFDYNASAFDRCLTRKASAIENVLSHQCDSTKIHGTTGLDDRKAVESTIENIVLMVGCRPMP
ncbi:unnamed protein product [Taenia asiatica]|uniref:Lyase_1 domain-containing protein n=1 Tax=Taenia asiatica TaxID=60517 RepID=A0A0R3VWG2_TAEAS|nr:unnamed protein product [Taenia asiatica]